MLLRKRVAFICFALSTFFLLATGVTYSVIPRIMPYHQAVIGVEWSAMTLGVQTMSRAFMRAAGAGFITAGLALTFILAIPYRKGERWARWGLLVISVSQYLLVFIQMVRLTLTTEATPPNIPFVIMFILALFGFFLTPAEPAIAERNEKV